MRDIRIMEEERKMPIEIGKHLFYDLEEASKKMDITAKVLRKWIKEGKLKAKKVGIKYYVTEEQMLDVFRLEDKQRP